MRVEIVEAIVERAWQGLRLTYEERQEAELSIMEAIRGLAEKQGRQRDELEAQREALLAERSKLLIAHYADAIPLTLLKIEQDRIGSNLAVIDEYLTNADSEQETVTKNLKEILNLLQHCDSAYFEGTSQLRRLMNQAFAEKIYIDEDGTGEFELEETVHITRTIAAPTFRKASNLTHPPPRNDLEAGTENSRGQLSSGVSVSASASLFYGKNLNKPGVVGLTGFEPATP